MLAYIVFSYFYTCIYWMKYIYIYIYLYIYMKWYWIGTSSKLNFLFFRTKPPSKLIMQTITLYQDELKMHQQQIYCSLTEQIYTTSWNIIRYCQPTESENHSGCEYANFSTDSTNQSGVMPYTVYKSLAPRSYGWTIKRQPGLISYPWLG